jgi:4-hydroxy-3-polyprenylbenzoate decarboxylase
MVAVKQDEAPMKPDSRRIILAVTGASGALYAERVLKALIEDGHGIELVLSSYGARLLKEERGLPGEPRRLVEALCERHGLSLATDQVAVHANGDLGAAISSGSYPVHGMAVVPASMRTIGAVAAGLADTLVDRAAMVTLKERRPLVLVPRETPLSRIHLQNLLRLHDAGAAIVPADPAFYQAPRTFEDLGDFIAARVMEQLGVPPSRDLFPRWGERG